MSKDNKNKVTQEEVVLDANDNGGEEIESEDLFWDELMTGRLETVMTLIGQQQLLIELAKMYHHVLNEDENLNASVDGLNKSYQDIGKDIRATMEKHITFEGDRMVDHKKGKVEGDDEYYDYIQIGGEYIAAQEKIANLASAAYLDIFTQLKVGDVELAKLKELPVEGKKIIDKALSEVEKGVIDGSKSK